MSNTYIEMENKRIAYEKRVQDAMEADQVLVKTDSNGKTYEVNLGSEIANSHREPTPNELIASLLEVLLKKNVLYPKEVCYLIHGIDDENWQFGSRFFLKKTKE